MSSVDVKRIWYGMRVAPFHSVSAPVPDLNCTISRTKVRLQVLIQKRGCVCPNQGPGQAL
jgi:hypothetical protein